MLKYVLLNVILCSILVPTDAGDIQCVMMLHIFLNTETEMEMNTQCNMCVLNHVVDRGFRYALTRNIPGGCYTTYVVV